MNKEWLDDKKEQLKNATVFINEFGNEAVEVSVSVLNKFIKTAERVQELESELNKQLEIGYFFEGETHDLAEQNKRYRELLTSKSMKQLIRLEDKGCFLPDEGREGFLDLKYAVEELEGEE